jgi:deoxyinosine 3'endonuclease (endonuclease V)
VSSGCDSTLDGMATHIGVSVDRVTFGMTCAPLPVDPVELAIAAIVRTVTHNGYPSIEERALSVARMDCKRVSWRIRL